MTITLADRTEVTALVDEQHFFANVTIKGKTWHFDHDLRPAAISRDSNEMWLCYSYSKSGAVSECTSDGRGRSTSEKDTDKKGPNFQSFRKAFLKLREASGHPDFPAEIREKVPAAQEFLNRKLGVKLPTDFSVTSSMDRLRFNIVLPKTNALSHGSHRAATEQLARSLQDIFGPAITIDQKTFNNGRITAIVAENTTAQETLAALAQEQARFAQRAS